MTYAEMREVYDMVKEFSRDIIIGILFNIIYIIFSIYYIYYIVLLCVIITFIK